MFTCTMCIWLAYRNLRSISYMYITKGHYHKRNFFKMFFIKLENTQVSKNCCNRCFNWVFNLTDNAVCISTLFSTNIDYYKFQFSIQDVCVLKIDIRLTSAYCYLYVPFFWQFTENQILSDDVDWSKLYIVSWSEDWYLKGGGK